MAGWLSTFKSKLTDLLGRTPSAHVGVFGKHVGWNDHIDDLGLDSEPLVAAKQALYVHGIGGVVDSGKWEPATPEEPALGFRHIFVWRDQTNILFGRLWDSSDGKGRTKYPMIICAHWSARPEPGIPDALAFLETLETECRKATTADEVHRIVSTAKLSAAQYLNTPAPIAGPRTAFAQQLGLTLDSEHAARIAYAAQNTFGAMKNASADIALSLTPDKLQPQHLRVPADLKQPLASIVFWQDFLAAFIGDTTPQFFLASLDSPWLDIIVGPLTPKHLACIRSGGQTVPVATDIPFNIVPADREKAGKCWAAFLG